MNKWILTAGLLIGGSIGSFGQCWKELSGFFAIKEDGTMWSFGNGDTVQVGSDSDWWKISAGYDHYLAIKTDSTLWGWGNHDHAQLGLGFGVQLAYPSPVSLGSDHDWVQVSAGTYSSMYLKANGDLYCSGGNNYGQLGIGGTSAQWIIVPVSGIGGNVKNVSTGNNGTLAVKRDGTLWFAGTRYFLDENDSNNQLTFEQQGTAADWDTVAVGLGHYLALKTNGELWAGGYNNSGQVGNGTYQHVNGTVQIGSDSWSKVAVEMYKSVGLKSDGTLYYWGGNDQISTPSQVGTADDYTNISHLLATRNYGLYGFGNGSSYVIDNCGMNLGFSDKHLENPSVYPNPVSETLCLSGISDQAEIQVFSGDGRMVDSWIRTIQGINVQSLNPGNYFLRVITDQSSSVFTFIRE
jgi:alpha-tubulin suppressor-like RCC1 family protein